jgi:hypothetical protein
MPEWWADFTHGHSLPGLALLALAGLLAMWLVARRLFRRQVGPDELEKRRRHSVNKNGKLGDGEIIDIEGSAIVYSYYVAGVGYTTSQDVGVLETSLPADRLAVIGPVSVKFLPANPANSIVLCEEWSGLRNRQPTREANS